MGIYEKPSKAFLDNLGAHFGFTPPREPGHNTVEALEAMLHDEVRVLIALGGNLAAAAPDSPRTEAALQRCQLTVHISTKLNRSHLITGEQDALILPTLGCTERDIQTSGPQFVTVEDSFSMLRAWAIRFLSNSALRPLSSPALLMRRWVASVWIGSRSLAIIRLSAITSPPSCPALTISTRVATARRVLSGQCGG